MKLNERGLVFRLGRFALYREIVAVDRVLYIGKPIRISDYKYVKIVRCRLRRLPWFRGKFSAIGDIIVDESQ